MTDSTTSNIICLTGFGNAPPITDFSTTIFSSDVTTIVVNNPSYIRVNMPPSQPTFKVVNVQNLNSTSTTLTVAFGATTYIISNTQELTVYYYGLTNFTPYKVYYSSSVAPVTSVNLASTYVSIDPVTFQPTFSPDIGLSWWSGGATGPGETAIQSTTPIKSVFSAPVAIIGDIIVTNNFMVDPSHFQVYSANTYNNPPIPNVSTNFWLIVTY